MEAPYPLPVTFLVAYALRMKSCPRCGAAIIDTDAGRCAICGVETAVARAPDGASLPPLPDGGLAAALPDWLREPPVAPPQPPLLTEADFPPWLLALADRNDSGPDLPSPTAAAAPDPPRIAPLFLPDAPLPTPVATAPKPAPIDEVARDREQAGDATHRQRVGVAAAALLVLLALLILFAWASGVRLPGLS